MIFSSGKIVIFISMDKIVVGDYTLDKPVFSQYSYDSNFISIFESIIAKYNKSKIFKIIMGSDVSYTHILPKPNLSNLTRDAIKEYVSPYIPEHFEDSQFDWQLLGDTLEVVVITSSLYTNLKMITQKHDGLEFQTQSSLSLLNEMKSHTKAQETGGEIFAYTAAKGNPTGSDESVLSIDITSPDSSTFSKSISQNFKPIYLILTIIILFILSLLYFQKMI